MTLKIIKTLFWVGVIFISYNHKTIIFYYQTLHNAAIREAVYSRDNVEPILKGKDYYCSSLNLDKNKSFLIPVLLRNGIEFDSLQQPTLSLDNAPFSDYSYDFYFGGKLVYKKNK